MAADSRPLAATETVRPTNTRQDLWWRAATGAVWLAATWYFYRGFFRAGFMVTQGDNGDGRLTEVLAGHWRNPLQFSGGFTDLGIFYPAGQGLMYSDSMLAFGILAAPLSWLGVDPSIAFQWSLIAVSSLGYFATVALLRTGPQAPWPLAITGGFVAAYSNGLLVASNHPQLLALNLLPVSLLLYLIAIRSSSSVGRGAAAGAAGLMFSLTTYTAFYIGWFATLGIALATVAFGTLVGPRRAAKTLTGPRGTTALAAVLGAVPVTVLFILTYLPLLLSGAGRSLEEIRFYALNPPDLFAVSPTNVLWFRPLYALFGGMSDTERAMAPTPLLVASAVVLLIWALASSRRRSPWMAAGSAATASGLLLWLSPVAWSEVFPWVLISAVPGADAIRAIGRIELMAGLLLTLGSACIAASIWRECPRGVTARILSLVLLCLIAAEQANYLVQQNVDVRSVQSIRGISAPPAECASFVVVPPFSGARAEDAQTDAAIVAQTHGVPTWNGSSGGAPAGWPLASIGDPQSYIEAVAAYGAERGILDYCTLSLSDGTWNVTPPR